MLGPYGDIEPECRFCHGTGVVEIMDGPGVDIPGLLIEWHTGDFKPCFACNAKELPY